MFGRATIRLGIGPHSSIKYVYYNIIMMLIGQIFIAGLCERKWSLRWAQCTHTGRIGAEFSWLSHRPRRDGSLRCMEV